MEVSVEVMVSFKQHLQDYRKWIEERSEKYARFLQAIKPFIPLMLDVEDREQYLRWSYGIEMVVSVLQLDEATIEQQYNNAQVPEEWRDSKWVDLRKLNHATHV